MANFDIYFNKLIPWNFAGKITVVIILYPADQWSSFINRAAVMDFIEMPADRITSVQPHGLRTVSDLAAALTASVTRKGWFSLVDCHALVAICWISKSFSRR